MRVSAHRSMDIAHYRNQEAEASSVRGLHSRTGGGGLITEFADYCEHKNNKGYSSKDVPDRGHHSHPQMGQKPLSSFASLFVSGSLTS